MDNFNPDKVDPEINKTIRSYIQDLIERKALDYNQMQVYFANCVQDNKYKEALLWCYYINNALKSNKEITSTSRQETIVEMLTFLNQYTDIKLEDYK